VNANHVSATGSAGSASAFPSTGFTTGLLVEGAPDALTAAAHLTKAVWSLVAEGLTRAERTGGSHVWKPRDGPVELRGVLLREHEVERGGGNTRIP